MRNFLSTPSIPLGVVTALGIVATLANPVSAQITLPAEQGAEQVAQLTQQLHDPRIEAPTIAQHAQRPFSRPTERVEAQLAYIKTALKITEAQQAAWDDYANLLRKQAVAREARLGEWQNRKVQNGGRPEWGRPTSVERIELHQRLHAAALSRLSELLQTVKPLYAVLTGEQRLVADQLITIQGSQSSWRPRHGRPHGPA